MSLPVPRAPDQDCLLCETVWEALDTILTTLAPMKDEPHILASLCAWWVANALELYHDDTRELFAMLADALTAQGFTNLPTPPKRRLKLPKLPRTHIH